MLFFLEKKVDKETARLDSIFDTDKAMDKDI